MNGYSRHLFIATAAVTTILLTAIYLYSPLETDDYWFLEGTQGMEHGFRMFLAACDTMKERWYTETGRLGNLINPVFLALLPKYVFDVISGVMFFIAVGFSCRLAAVKAGSLYSYILLAGLVFCFPWYDYMFCITFGINYVWGISLALMASYYLLRPLRRGWQTALACVLCFCAGWFHEGFGAPMSCAAVTVAAIRWHRNALDRDFILKLICLCVGTLMICVSPVFWTRAEIHVSNIVKFPFKELVMQIGPSAVILVLYIFSVVLATCFRRNRNRLQASDPTHERILFFSVLLAAATAITIKYYNGPRTGAAVITFGIVGSVWLLEKSLRVFHASRLGVCMKGLIAAMMFINLSCAAMAQRKINAEYHRIVNLFSESPDGTIYFDITFPKADPTLFKTTVRQFHERIPKQQIAHYLDPDKTLVILPTALERTAQSDMTPATRSGFYICKGYILCDPGAAPETYQIKVITTDGREMHTRYRLDSFRTDQGKELIFVMPHVQTLDPDLRISDVCE